MTNMNSIVIVSAWLGLLAVITPAAPAQELAQAAQALTARDDHMPPDEVRGFSRLLKANWNTKEAEDFEAVLDMASDIRLGIVLDAMIDVAHPGELEILVQRASSWVVRRDTIERASLERLGFEGAARHVLESLRTSGRYREVCTSPHWLALVEGAMASAVSYGSGRFGRSIPVALWLDTPMSAVQREHSAISIVERMRRSDVPHEVANAIASEDGRRHLRALLLEGTSPRIFHMGAASALAELGDQPTLAILDILAPQLTARGYTDGTVPRARGPMGVVVVPYAQRISVQSTPDLLLGFIARYGDDDPALHALRTWAIGRALRMEVRHDDVRVAVVAYLTAATAAKATGHCDLGAGSSIREVAVREGLVAEGEFRDLIPVSSGIFMAH